MQPTNMNYSRVVESKYNWHVISGVVYEMNVKKWRMVALDLFQFELQTVVRKFGRHIEVDSRLGKFSTEFKLRFN